MLSYHNNPKDAAAFLADRNHEAINPNQKYTQKLLTLLKEAQHKKL